MLLQQEYKKPCMSLEEQGTENTHKPNIVEERKGKWFCMKNKIFIVEDMMELVTMGEIKWLTFTSCVRMFLSQPVGI